MRKIIYTAIIGDYDTLKEPSVVNKDWQYICYTNNKNLKSDIWDIRPLPYYDLNLSPTKQARKIKILPPFEYDVCIWADGSIRIQCNLDEFIDKYHKAEITTLKHPHRNCVYREADACIKRKKDNPNTINNQISIYKSEGYPENNGMIGSGVIIRSRSLKVNVFCNQWWHQVQSHSHRDQLSFNFTLKYNPVSVHLIPFDILSNEFLLTKHKVWKE